ncbi:hypothetical protein jhhlp_000499 [Lomentospora prolificans]|uniref:Uncharacterized protein n=1 Tax=Lomentospora prolificans TaxID=41688 RepID=A0A2N3NL48_9PEZI|nr:hypothetical protein jhhlp_000499 [Lomentospora prolificans]
MCTAKETKARFWDIDSSFAVDADLDDASFRNQVVVGLEYNIKRFKKLIRSIWIAILFRLPRKRRDVMAIMRIQLWSGNCVTLLTCNQQDDLNDLRQRCVEGRHLLKTHPLYLLSFVYEQRYHVWMDWLCLLWQQVAELEAVTDMARPLWKLPDLVSDREEMASTADKIFSQMHGTNVGLWLCHGRSVMASARRFGTFCSEVVDELERERRSCGFRPVHRRTISGLQESFKFTTTRLESVTDRVTELKDRLAGHMDVSYNLIAQSNNDINLAIAKMQSYDSRTVKGIAILTLLFLPSTLIAVRSPWTAYEIVLLTECTDSMVN